MRHFWETHIELQKSPVIKLQQKSPIEAVFVKNSLETVFGIRYYSASSIPHASWLGLGLRAMN